MNLKNLGSKQKKLIRFLLMYDSWHTYATDYHTKKLVDSLVGREIIEITEEDNLGMMRLKTDINKPQLILVCGIL